MGEVEKGKGYKQGNQVRKIISLLDNWFIIK